MPWPIAAAILGGGAISAASNIWAGITGRNAQNDANQKNADLQREFAQMGIRWKMADAEAAGLHPTVAAGAQGYSAAPSYVGDTSMSQGLSNMGQDVGRAVTAAATSQERQIHDLTVQRMQLENKKLGLEVGGIQASQVGPPMPGETALVKPQPARPVVQRPDAPGQEPGSIADYGYVRNGDRWYIVPSKDVKERTEDNFVQELGWSLRNQVAPFIKHMDDAWAPEKYKHSKPTPPDAPLPKGMQWHWDGISYSQRRAK